MIRALSLTAVFSAALLASGCGSAMENAVRSGDQARVRALLKSGVSVESRNQNWGFGRPIYLAAERGDVPMMKLLVENGAVLKPNDQGALYVAAMNGHREAVKYAISLGVDPQPFIDSLDANPHPRHAQMSAFLRSVLSAPPRPIATAAAAAAAFASGPAAAPLATPNYSLPERPDDLAVVVGVEEYSEIATKAPYAERDADAFKSFVRALGVPERNIVLLKGPKAVKSSLEKNLEGWLPRLAKPDSRVYFYFSGHGAPEIKTGQAYLVPWDGDPNFLEATAYPVSRLYQKLGALPAKQVLVAMDSCFSGAGGRSVLASGARPLVGKVETGAVPAKVTVLAASAASEISGSLDDRQHGAFTYFLLEGLNAGKTGAKALHAYLTPKVQDEARRLNRDQTPQFLGTDLTLR